MISYASPAARVGQLAILVRITHILALLVLDAALPDYDTSTALLGSPSTPLPCTAWKSDTVCNSTHNVSDSTDMLSGGAECPMWRDSSADTGLMHHLWGLMVWDSVFFLDIARCGWRFEHYYAFFPLFPVMAGTLLSSQLFPVAAIGLSITASTASAVLLYWLTRQVLGSERHAATASLLYIFGPASLFHTLAYTEALFTALTLGGLCLLYCKRSLIGAAVCFHLACWTRSNGIINTGYLMHYTLSEVLAAFTPSGKNRVLTIRGGMSKVATQALKVVWAVVLSCMVAYPFLAFQAAGQNVFCQPQDLSQNNNGNVDADSTWHGSKSSLVGGRGPWCGYVLGMYSSVQARYWGVGFGKYYEIQQIPNFLLAAPALLLSLAGVVSYALACKHHILTGGFASPVLELQVSKAKRQQQRAGGYFSRGVAVHIYPWAFQTSVALTVMHVQVATRFLSCCPPFHWFAASLLLHQTSGSAQVQGPPRQRAGRNLHTWIWFYCGCYAALGSTLFSNFYPWT